MHSERTDYIKACMKVADTGAFGDWLANADTPHSHPRRIHQGISSVLLIMSMKLPELDVQVVQVTSATEFLKFVYAIPSIRAATTPASVFQSTNALQR